MKEKNKKIISTKKSLILILIFSILITELMLILSGATIEPSLRNTFVSIIYNALIPALDPLLFILNFVPVFIIFMLIYLIFNSAVLSISLSSLLIIIFNIINIIKISLRQDPLIPSDFTLVTEVFSLLDKYGGAYLIFALIFIIFALILIVTLSLKFKSEKISIPKRIICIFIMVVTAITLNNTVYSDETLYDKFDVRGSYYFKVNHYKSKGLVYSFLNDFNTMKVEKPEGYDEELYIADLEDSPNYENAVKPHVIVIMSEAFSDLSENKNIDFSNYEDPMKNFKEIANSDNAVSGHITVPNFGGGTADTEFDVLTGCSTSLIDNTLTSYMFVNKNMDSMCSALERIGYDSLAIHPGYPWFYNRQNVYEYMGFDNFLHLDNAFDLEKDGVAGYIKEEATTEKIISSFSDHIQTSDNPYFEFCVTIENHGPFDNKYGISKNFDTNKDITETEQNILSNYFEGVKNCDKMLKDLTDYFNSIDEPVILTFFGDHLPGFPGEFELLKKLEYDMDINGTTEQRMNLYKTPFIIWQNDCYKELVSVKETYNSLSMPENNTISASYLGALTLELAGFKNITPFFSYKNEERQAYPVIEKRGYMDINGNYYDNLPDETNRLNYLKGYIYYKLFDEDIIFDEQ